MDEKRVQIAAKLYDARDTVRRLFAKSYLERVEQFKDFVRSEMKQTGKGELEAAMKIVRDLQRDCPDSGMTQAMILAACVELIEPAPPARRTCPRRFVEGSMNSSLVTGHWSLSSSQ